MLRNEKKTHSYTKKRILINNLYPGFRLQITQSDVRGIVSKVMDGEDCRYGEIILNFGKDREIKRINAEFLGHKYYTDIITFPYNYDKNNIEGEIFISLDSVKKNGTYYHSGFKTELKRVIIHGCLHLAGYKDSTKKEKELIRQKEDFYLSNQKKLCYTRK